MSFCGSNFQDCRVIIWTNDGNSNSWTSKVLHKFNDVIWHVSWSITGNILAVSGGDNKVCESEYGRVGVLFPNFFIQKKT